MAPVPEDEAKNVANDLDSIENLDFPDVIIPPGTSDSDDIDDGTELGGYELLPQDPVELSNAYIHEDEDDEVNIGLSSLDNGSSTEDSMPSSTTSNSVSLSGQTWRTSEPADSHQPHLTHYPSGCAGSYLQAPELPKPDKSEILWNQPYNSSTNSIKMDEHHAAEIKAAMAGFKLPMSSVPDWAKNVSEEQWKDSIIPKILSPEKR